MEPLRMLVTSVIVGVVLYFIFSMWTPILNVQTNFSKAAENVLIEAQSDVGQSASISLSVSKDQSLFARNFDTTTRSVSFSCAGSECCPIIENCPSAYASTRERMLTLQDTDFSLTARCELSGAGIHACTLYVGKEPAQVRWENVSAPDGALEAGDEITFSGTVRNTGELMSDTLNVRVELWGTIFENGKETMKIIEENEQTLEQIDTGKTASVNIPITITTPGEYRAALSVEGADSGKDTREFALTISGETVSLCAPDYTRAYEKEYDAFDDVCREKRFCNDCDFAFSCRQAWQREQPVSLPQFYDPTRGETGFTYLLTPAGPNGQC